MSLRNELLALLACTGAWLLAIGRVRDALAFDGFAAAPAQVNPSTRAQVLYDVARIGRQGAFRPLARWSVTSPDTATGMPVITIERPPVHLKGVMGGPPWLAVLSMHDAAGDDRVFRAGDSLGVVEVRAVRADGVTVRFQDSTWTIPLRETERP